MSRAAARIIRQTQRGMESGTRLRPSGPLARQNAEEVTERHARGRRRAHKRRPKLKLGACFLLVAEKSRTYGDKMSGSLVWLRGTAAVQARMPLIGLVLTGSGAALCLICLNHPHPPVTPEM